MKKTIQTIIIAGILLCMGSFAFADALDNKNAIGMYVIGSERPVGGIQYERRFTDLISTKFGTYALIRDKNYYNTTPVEFNFVVEPDFCLYQTSWNDKVSSRLFAFGMIGYDYQQNVSYHYDRTLDEQVADPKTDKDSLIVGAGFGFDFIFFGHLSVPLQFGFTGTLEPEDPFLGFGGGIAIRYSW